MLRDPDSDRLGQGQRCKQEEGRERDRRKEGSGEVNGSSRSPIMATEERGMSTAGCKLRKEEEGRE
ncbi:hypothetical protein ACLOJK_010317 [Asimina triloba]